MSQQAEERGCGLCGTALFDLKEDKDYHVQCQSINDASKIFYLWIRSVEDTWTSLVHDQTLIEAMETFQSKTSAIRENKRKYERKCYVCRDWKALQEFPIKDSLPAAGDDVPEWRALENRCRRCTIRAALQPKKGKTGVRCKQSLPMSLTFL